VTKAPVSSIDLNRRFGGLRRLWGDPGAEACLHAHVVVVGLGGVGSWAVEALARSGIGALTLIDLDHVSESNINRQIQATDLTLGQAKAVALEERIQRFHPGCRIHAIEEFVDATNAADLLAQACACVGPISAVLDACDQVSAKLALSLWTHRNRVPFVTVGAAGGKKWSQFVRVADLSKVTHDPLLARLRQKLRKEHGYPSGGKSMKLSCVYSEEPISAPMASCEADGQAASDGTLNCHGYGSLVAVTASMGMAAAGVVLNGLAGVSVPTAK